MVFTRKSNPTQGFKAVAYLQKRGKKWYYTYTDEHGKTRQKVGTACKDETQRIAALAEHRVYQIKNGLVCPRDLEYADHQKKPLSEHLAVWQSELLARDNTEKHARTYARRVKILTALILGGKLEEIDRSKGFSEKVKLESAAKLDSFSEKAKLSDLRHEKVQAALFVLKNAGRSNQTCNHYRTAIRSFSRWCHNTYRTREDILRGVTGFNAETDKRRDRRALSLSDLQRLIDAAREGSPYRKMTGPARALCYRLAVATGLRYSEILTLTPESFDFDVGTPYVTVKAAYSKNRKLSNLPFSQDLAKDLIEFVRQISPNSPVFQLPDNGAKMIQRDLAKAGIPYRDSFDQVFDFHALRCQLATNASQAGIPPRVVQRLMRHSSLALTDRYTKPRQEDLEIAVENLPNLS